MTDKPTITKADNRWRCHHCQTVTISKICPERCFECKYPALSPVTPVKPVNSAAVAELQAEVERLREALEYYAKDHDVPDEGPWGIGSDDFGNVARAALAQKEPVE